MWAGGTSITITNTTVYNDKAKAGPGGSGGAAKSSSPKVNPGARASLAPARVAVSRSRAARPPSVKVRSIPSTPDTSGGGVFESGGSLTVNNTILGANQGGDIVKNGGTLTGGYNLIEDATYRSPG